MDKQMKHTRTPWKTEAYRIQTMAGHLVAEAKGSVSSVSWVEAKDTANANAELIVRAVNSHQALVDALGEAVLQIEYLHERTQETGSGNAVLARARAALRKARGEDQR